MPAGGATGGGSTSPNAATLTSFTASATNFNAGQAVSLSWASSGAEVCTGRTLLPSNAQTSFNSANLPLTSSGTAVVLANSTTSNLVYQFELRCMNVNGGAFLTTNQITVAPAPAGGGTLTENCPIDKATLADSTALNDPRDLFKPTGFNGLTKTFSEAFGTFGHVVTWPLANSYIYPMQVPAKGQYLSMQISPTATQYDLSILEAQPTALYYTARRGLPYITLSPCKGDFRLADTARAGADPSLHESCRKFGASGTLKYGLASTSSYAKCAVAYTDRPYYLNMIMAYPNDGITISETTCDGDLSLCEFSATHKEATP